MIRSTKSSNSGQNVTRLLPAVTKYDPFSAKLIAFTFVDTLLLATCKIGRIRKKKVKVDQKSVNWEDKKKKVKVVKILDIWICSRHDRASFVMSRSFPSKANRWGKVG